MRYLNYSDMQIQFIHTWYWRRKNSRSPVKFNRSCFHGLKICEPSRHDRKDGKRDGDGGEWWGREDKHAIVGIANVWHKRLVKTSWETPPARRTFEAPRAGVDSPPEEERVREMRVTRPVTEFSDRPLPDDPPSGDAHFARIPFSRSGARDYALNRSPPIQGTEKCHWLLEFRIGTTTRSADGEENRWGSRARGSPTGVERKAIGNRGSRKETSFRNEIKINSLNIN